VIQQQYRFSFPQCNLYILKKFTRSSVLTTTNSHTAAAAVAVVVVADLILLFG
jgi:hypothetical protein